MPVDRSASAASLETSFRRLHIKAGAMGRQLNPKRLVMSRSGYALPKTHEPLILVDAETLILVVAGHPRQPRGSDRGGRVAV